MSSHVELYILYFPLKLTNPLKNRKHIFQIVFPMIHSTYIYYNASTMSGYLCYFTTYTMSVLCTIIFYKLYGG